MEENTFDAGTLSSYYAGTLDRTLREKLVSSNVFTDWLQPQNKEARQILEQYDMDLVEPSLKMQGLKAAGINPLTAAAGIAGNGSSAVPQPTQSVNPIGDIAGSVANVAGASDSFVSAISTFSKLPSELKNIDADTASKLAAAGLTYAQTQGVITDNTYKDEDWLTRLNVQRQQFDNMRQELSNMQAVHSEILTHVDEMLSQIELNGSVKDYNEALLSKVEEESRWMKELNDWRISHNLHIFDSGIDGYIFDMCLNGADLSRFDNFIDIYSNWRGQTQLAISNAQNESDINAAFDKAFNAALGNTDVAARFAPYFSDIELLRDSIKELYKTLVENPGDPFSFVGKILNLLYSAPAGLTTQDNVSVNPPARPNVAPISR